MLAAMHGWYGQTSLPFPNDVDSLGPEDLAGIGLRTSYWIEYVRVGENNGDEALFDEGARRPL